MTRGEFQDLVVAYGRASYVEGRDGALGCDAHHAKFCAAEVSAAIEEVLAAYDETFDDGFSTGANSIQVGE